MFGCCKTFSGKGKCFHGVWLHFKKFSGKYFLVFGKEEGKHKLENADQKTQATNPGTTNDDRADDRTVPTRSRRLSARCAALFSLSLSLSFRKLIEVKMRGENDFRVKGENTGQPEVIFRKMIFSVTAKHAEKGENDFLKSFSPKTNAP